MTIQFRWNGTSIVSAGQNQWQPNDGTGAPLPVSDTGITADLSQSLGAITAQADATSAIAADSAQALGAVTMSAAGSVAATADSSQTLGAVVVAGAAAGAIAASATMTLDAITGSAIESSAIAAAISQTLGALTLSSDAGDDSVTADLGVTLDDIALSADATVSQPDTGDAVVGPQAFAATVPRPRIFHCALNISGGGSVVVAGHKDGDAAGENARAFWRLVVAAENMRLEKS